MINKTVYIPTEEDIYNLEIIKRASGVNNIDIYGYLIAKTIEKLISNNKFISNIDSYLLEIPEIVHGICWLYPQELFSSSTARQDYDLCSGLLTKQTDQTIYNLDNVSKFDKNIQLNYEIKQKVIKILEEKIISTPEYRFTYQQGVLLDAIFGVKAEEFNNLPVDIQVKLANIDPTYVLKLNLRDLIRDVVGKDKIVVKIFFLRPD